MNVSQLIKSLQKFPDTMPVMVKGFDETGFDPVATLEIVELVRVAPEGKSGHSGAFEEVEDARHVRTFCAPFSALMLNF